MKATQLIFLCLLKKKNRLPSSILNSLEPVLFAQQIFNNPLKLKKKKNLLFGLVEITDRMPRRLCLLFLKWARTGSIWEAFSWLPGKITSVLQSPVTTLFLGPLSLFIHSWHSKALRPLNTNPPSLAPCSQTTSWGCPWFPHILTRPVFTDLGLLPAPISKALNAAFSSSPLHIL